MEAKESGVKQNEINMNQFQGQIRGKQKLIDFFLFIYSGCN